LRAIQCTAPGLYRLFEPIQEAIGTPDEQRVIKQVYQGLPSLNFSKSVLENLSHENRQNLRVLPVRGVTWNDWGSSERLTRTLRQLGAPDLVTPEEVVSGRRVVSVLAERHSAAARRIQ
jgi:hypothetical protein